MEIKEEKVTIAERMNAEYRVFNTILDIGCGNAQYLYDFKKFGFRKAIGVDKMLPNINPVKHYTDHLVKTLGIGKGDALGMYYAEDSWLKFFGGDFDKYLVNNPTEKYSLIICRNVLHFYPDSQKYQIIAQLYNQLEPDGLLYIELNNNKHPDTLSCEHVEGNTYIGFKDYDKTKWYYADENEFQNQTAKFNPVGSLYQCDNHSLKIVFRKLL